MYHLEKIKGITLLQFPFFTETKFLTHGFTTRLGGVSEKPYDSLNMGFTVEDDPVAVLTNRKLTVQGLSLSMENLVAAKQIHQDKIAIISKNSRGKGAFTYDDALEGTDALITEEKNIILSTYYADCVPILILDPHTPAIGLAHAGWKGTALKIGAKTILKMKEAFGTEIATCKVVIGPSIGPCCYQVDGVVKDFFNENISQSDKFFTKTSNVNWQLDLWKANKSSLIEIGLPEEQIVISNLCTACNRDLFFSHRTENGLTGRMAALMMLKD